jgi:hypothetical protein
LSTHAAIGGSRREAWREPAVCCPGTAIEWAAHVGDSALAASLLRACAPFGTNRGRSELGELVRAALDLQGAEAMAYAMAAFFADGAEQIALTETGLALPDHVEHDKLLLYSQLAAGRATTGAGGTIDAIRRATEQAYAHGTQLDQAYWEGIMAESAAMWDAALAGQHAERGLAFLDRWMDHPDAAGALGRIAGYEALLGNFDEAVALCDTATRLARDSRWWFNVWPVVSATGRWFERHERIKPATIIQGYFEHRGRLRTGFDLVTPMGIDYTLHPACLNAGAEMSGDELVDLVLDELGAAG